MSGRLGHTLPRSGKSRNPAKRPVLECPASGMREHDLPDCWHVLDKKRPFFDGKRTQLELIDSINELVEKVSVAERQAGNERVFEESTNQSSNHGTTKARATLIRLQAIKSPRAMIKGSYGDHGVRE